MIRIIAILFFICTQSFAQLDEQKDKIERLIKQLGSPDFKVREHAKKSLEKIGEPALSYLKQAAQSQDPEVSWSAKRIIKKITKSDYKAPKKENHSSKKSSKGMKEFEFDGPGFYFKFKYSKDFNDLFKFFNNPDKFMKRFPRSREMEKLWKEFPNWKKLPSLNKNSRETLTVVNQNKRYHFKWNKKLIVSVTDFFSGKQKTIEVRDLKELKKLHPELYQVYIDNGGNSIFRRVLPKNFSPRLKKAFPKKFFEFIPEDLKEDMQDFERRWQKAIPDFFQSEEKVKKQLRKFQDRLDFQKSFYGVQCQPVGEVIRAQLNLAKDEGIVVSVVSSGLLKDAGVQKWDVILKIGKYPIKDILTLKNAIKTIPAGKKETIYIIRKGTKKQLTLVKNKF